MSDEGTAVPEDVPQTEKQREDSTSPTGSDDTEKSDTQKDDKDVFIQPAPPEMTAKEKMVQEELKLKSKYPALSKPGVGSSLLHKRMRGGQKYFDSGDYNMAKAKITNPKKPLAPTEKMILQESIGETIPTPEDLPPRKASLATSKLVNSTS